MYCCYCLVTKSCLTLLWLHGLVCQASQSMEFPRQEYWSGLPFPSPEELLDPGIKIKPVSPALRVDSLSLSHVCVCVCVCVCIHQEYKNIKPPTRFSLQYLITIEEQHLKKRKYNGKKWFIETQLEITHMLELSEKNIK